jgi:MATE family multidrug resistance protein
MSAVMQTAAFRAPWIVREARATLTLAAPLIVGKLSSVGQNTVDVLLAGHLNAHVLASVAIGTAIWVLVFMVLSGLAYALSPAVAQLDGAGRRHETAPLLAQALRVGGVIGIALMLLVRFGGPAIVRAIGTAPALVPDVVGFLHAVSWGAPALAIYLVCMGFSEGLSLPRPSMVTGLLGLLVLAPVGYTLMYGAFGAPTLGARGSGYAAALVPWVQALAMGLWFRLSRRYRGTGWGARRRGWDLPAIRGLLGIGVPIAVSQLSESTLFTAAALLISRFGAVQAAAHQIAIIVAATTFMVPLGFAFAITVRVGNAIGRRDPGGARRAGLVGIGLSLAAQGTAALCLLTLPRHIAGLFTPDEAVIGTASVLLRIAGAFQLSDGLQVACMGALRGLKDTRAPMLITTLSYWGVGMSLGVWLGLREGFGAPGVWWGLVAGLTTAAMLLYARFLRRTRRPR